jgi:hypothetical protein
LSNVIGSSFKRQAKNRNAFAGERRQSHANLLKEVKTLALMDTDDFRREVNAIALSAGQGSKSM